MTAEASETKVAAKAKIVATLGPASSTPPVIKALVDAGADAFRLNFSHGLPGQHLETAACVRSVAGNVPVAIVADLQGPRIRIGALPAPVAAREGEEIVLASGRVPPGSNALPTTHAALASDLKPGDRVLVDNGLIELRVASIEGGLVRCRVIVAGEIGSNKGINLPGVRVSAPALTEKDRNDLTTAVRLGADYIALSFVRSAEDVDVLRALIRSHGVDTHVIAKIERPEAVEQFESIVEAADGVMVARGDLGVEISEENVPGIQKRLIAQANAAGKPVITATEMLQSMVTSARPTRAEASDVANAILDGTDAVMLSGETAVGRYPVESVRMMERITREAETIRRERPVPARVPGPSDFATAAAEAACAAARDIQAVAIVVFTMSGRTARLVAQRRPNTMVVALTPLEQTRRRLALVWGVRPFLLPPVAGANEMVAAADALLKRRHILSAGQPIVIVGGSGPLTGATNFTKMHRVR